MRIWEWEEWERAQEGLEEENERGMQYDYTLTKIFKLLRKNTYLKLGSCFSSFLYFPSKTCGTWILLEHK